MIRKDEKKEEALKALFEELLTPCVKAGTTYINEEGTATYIW